MKMSKELYSTIENAINGLIDYVDDKNEIVNLRKNINYSKCQFTSFVFKMFYLSCNFAKQNKNVDIYSMLKNEGLNDSHIETALKKILSKYK